MFIRIIIPLISSGLTLCVHMAFSVFDTYKSIKAFDPEMDISLWGIYSSSFQIYTGFSIALAVLFLTYSILKYIQLKETAGKNILKGVMISFILFLILSFSLGYYTISIEEFYIKKMGYFMITAKQMGILLVAIISVIPGYVFVLVKTRNIK